MTSESSRGFPSTAAEQLATALVGAALLGAARRGRAGTAMRIAGAGLLGLAVRPFVQERVSAAGARRRHVAASESIEIERPVGDVFAFFKDFESFPQFAGALRSVIDYQDGRSHWEIYTPSGDVVALDVVVTKYMPNSVIAWESVPGSGIAIRGLVRFTSLGPSTTRLDVHADYRPANTTFNEAVQALLARRSSRPLASTLEHARFYLESLPPRAIELDEPRAALALPPGDRSSGAP